MYVNKSWRIKLVILMFEKYGFHKYFALFKTYVAICLFLKMKY